MNNLQTTFITQSAAKFIFDYMWSDKNLNQTNNDVNYYIKKLNLQCMTDTDKIFELLRNYSLLNINNFIDKTDSGNFQKLKGELMKYFGLIIPANTINCFVELFEQFLFKHD